MGTAGLKGPMEGVDWRKSASIALMLQVRVCVCVADLFSHIPTHVNHDSRWTCEPLLQYAAQPGTVPFVDCASRGIRVA